MSERRRVLISLALIAVGACHQTSAQKKEKGGAVSMPVQIRESPFAGTWYSGRKDSLLSDLTRMLAVPKKEGVPGSLLALISPHAGYVYSGPVAAHGYRQLEGRSYETVVLVGPSHKAFFQGCAVYDQGIWKTPLGDVEVDSSLAAEIIRQDPSDIHGNPQAHREEHSLEIQLPFLQRQLTGFKIVPIMMFEQDYEACKRLGEAIARAVKDKKVLLVASSDLSHYHPDRQAKILDNQVVSAVEAFDAKRLEGSLKSGTCEACGGGPVMAVMIAAKALGGDKVKILRYATSGDITGDRTQVVGYLSAGIWKSKDGANTDAKDTDQERLTEAERKDLLRIARTTIEKKLKGEALPKWTPLTSLLGEKRGAFVTLREHGELRGCIGYIEALKPLYLAVSDMAQAAAFNDPRFTPLTKAEWPKVDIEISVLSPLRKVADYEEVVAGKHGVVIEMTGRSGVFLPQVATEEGWDRDTFLEYLCLHKAGLPRDAYKSKQASLSVFTADVFSEK
jgi:AmmeMemoRadiSam system protein B/AmmeMemoRadiSam system protein A